MKKVVPILLFLICALQGCSTIDSFSKQDDSCPAPSKEQLNKNGYLMLQDGVTLKCQVKKYTSRMSCTGITDSTGADGWACNNGNNQALFLFDENGILKGHKF